MEMSLWRFKKNLLAYILNWGNKNSLATRSSHSDVTSGLSRKRASRPTLYMLALCLLCLTLWTMFDSDGQDVTVGIVANGQMVKAVYKCAVENKDGTLDLVFNIPGMGRNSSMHNYLLLNTTNFPKEDKLGQNATTKIRHQVRSEYPVSLDADYVINAPYLCQVDRPVDYLIIVHSATTYSARRRVIRETYGSQKLFGNIIQRVVFLLGTTNDPATTRSIQEEAFLNRDIVQGQFIDSYHSLTHKGILGLKWITEYCPQAKVIIKIDDDVFVNPFKLVQQVLPVFKNKTRHIACHLRRAGTSPILRGKGKWVVHEDEFRGLRHYPFDYCNGYFVIITRDLILPMLRAARLNPFFWIDDVYLFGLLPATAGSTKFVDIKSTLTLRFDYGNKCYQDNGAKCKLLAVSQWRSNEPDKFWYMVLSNLTMAVKKELRVFGLT